MFRYAVPSTPIALARSTGPNELNALVNELLNGMQKFLFVINFTVFIGSNKLEHKLEFTFLINYEIFTSSLHDHLEEKQIFLEFIEIEYYEKQKPPNFEKEIEQNDLVSCIKRNGKQ